MPRKKDIVKETASSSNPVKQKLNDEVFGFISQSEFADMKHKPDKNIFDVNKTERKIKKWAIETGRLEQIDKGLFKTKMSKETEQQMVSMFQDMKSEYGDCVLEFADNSFRVRKAKADIGSPIVEFSDAVTGKVGKDGMIVETAEDDRVIGIPYSIANIGADKYYVINGRVYSGWAMWFGVQAIRSPEDYARNVDLTYNIPFVWSGFQLKSQLSLGASFDILHGTEDEVTPEEDFLNEMFTKLNISVNKLSKTSFHLDMYGNSYWHIRRNRQGVPDKVTILQPERIKVFLDPKTTKVLYYIYLPPILAGMALTPYPNIRQNPNLMWGPSLTYPTPIVIDPQDILHFKENDYTEFPYGISSCKAMLDPATARMDINVVAPMIFKRYAKPLIHWRMDPINPFQLSKGQIESYINGMKDTLENLEPMSDPITSTRWTANPVGAAQGKAELLTILQDLDNQIFASMGVSESYFKPQLGTDRMLAEQDKTLLAAMQQRQRLVGEGIYNKIVKPAINTYDRNINLELEAQGQELLPVRKWNEYPTLQWRETFKQDQVTTIQNTLALLQAGLIDHSRAARRVGEAPPMESEELGRAQDLNKITQEVQIENAKLQFLQAQLGQVDTQVVLQAGGTMAVQMAQQAAAEEAAAESGEEVVEDRSKSRKQIDKDSETRTEKQVRETQEDVMYRVTFINKSGRKQVEEMRGSTLEKNRAAGTSILKIEPAGKKGENPNVEQQ